MFGSIVKGNYKIDSDIDVTVVLPKVENEIERAEIVSKIYKKLGIEDPIELHVISKEEFENWYSSLLMFMKNFKIKLF